MRLTHQEVHSIKDVISKWLPGLGFQVFLFGSRVDDQKKGGDIDLLILVSPEHFKRVLSLKSALRFDLEAVVGDQRVDLTVATKETVKGDPFLQSIEHEMVLLFPHS